MNRRTFLRRSAVGGGVVTAGAAYLGLRVGSELPKPTKWLKVFDETSFGVLVLFAERILDFEGVEAVEVAHRIDLGMRYATPESQADTNLILAVLENSLSGIFTRGSVTLFSELTTEGRDAAIRRWGSSSIGLLRGATNGLRKLCLGNHYGPLAAAQETGYPGPSIGKIEPPPIAERAALSKPWTPPEVAAIDVEPIEPETSP